MSVHVEGAYLVLTLIQDGLLDDKDFKSVRAATEDEHDAVVWIHALTQATRSTYMENSLYVPHAAGTFFC